MIGGGGGGCPNSISGKEKQGCGSGYLNAYSIQNATNGMLYGGGGGGGGGLGQYALMTAGAPGAVLDIL